MMMIGICDDQQSFLDHEVQTVRNLLEKRDILFQIRSFAWGKELELALEDTEFDILFLDIDLADTDGFHIAGGRMNTEHTSLVFVSSYDDLALDSFDYHPYSFIAKSQYDTRINGVLENCIQRFEGKRASITITCNRELVKLYTKEIAYVESSRNAVVFHMVHISDAYKTTMTMSQVETKLASAGFMRIHAAFTVNLGAVRRIAREVVLDNGTQLPMSKKYATAFKTKYAEYMRKHL